MHPNRFHMRNVAAMLVLVVFATSACAPPRQVAEVTSRPVMRADTVRAYPASPAQPAYEEVPVPHHVNGRMWVFDALPYDWWAEEYDLRPDSSWSTRAMRGALRLGTFCSASFVSAEGLVLTNHHCVRDQLEKVEQDGENLLKDGFVARHDSLERRIPDLYVDELLRIENVTDEVRKAAEDVRGAGPRMDARRKRAEAIERRMTEELNGSDSLYVVEVFETWSAYRYSAYVYRRHRDVRLVLVPSESAGYFGGDADNFSWPRHTLDMAFLRVRDREGHPHKPAHYFSVDTTSVQSGDAVFVVGNPGTTDRLSPVSILEYERDVTLPRSIAVLMNRQQVLRNHSERLADSLANDLMTLENTLKAERGSLEGLNEGDVLAVRYTADQVLQRQFAQEDSLAQAFGNLQRDLRLLQQSKRISARKAEAFTHFLNPVASSRILARAMYGYVLTLSRQRGADDEALASLRKDALNIEDWPRDVERDMIQARLMDVIHALGETDPTVRRLLDGKDAATIADSMVTHTRIAEKDAFQEILDENYLASGDVTVPLIEALAPLYFTLDAELSGLVTRENALLTRLEEGRYRVEATPSPPDASFKLRISDGRVKGVDSTSAFTTFAGLFALAERQGAGAQASPWSLPKELDGHAAVLRDIPLNLVATTDIAGGNSGSPLLSRDLDLVGLVFDSNWDALPSNWVFGREDGRTIAVDIRAIVAMLRHAYGADHVLHELLNERP
ncbi:MAG: S46 family peptidase [Rhodothermales bacterium]